MGVCSRIGYSILLVSIGCQLIVLHRNVDISRKVTKVSEISHLDLRARWKELTEPINHSSSSTVQGVAPR